MNKKFKDLLVQHGRSSWRSMDKIRIILSPELLRIVFIHYKQWGYVNNIYSGLRSFRSD